MRLNDMSVNEIDAYMANLGFVYVPHHSDTNDEGQGVIPAECVLVPFSAPCIGCGECKN